MGGGPALSVYLVHWNQPEWCGMSVESIRRSTVPVRITVVNNSPESAEELERRLPDDVQIVTSGDNLGYSGGANAGLTDWLGRNEEFVVVGSHDLQVDPAAFERLLAAGRAHPEFGVLGPVVTSKPSGSSSAAELVDGEAVTSVPWLSGTCLFLRRACVERVGGFDAALGSYFEDVDLCWRVAAAGWAVGLVAGATVSDLGSGSVDAPHRAQANFVRITRIHRGNIAAARALASLLLALVRAAVGGVLPWRPAADRATSRRRSANLARSVGRLPVVFRPARTRL